MEWYSSLIYLSYLLIPLQLLLRPFPHLQPQRIILSLRRLRPLNPNRLIVLPAPHLSCHRRPQLIPDALVHRRHDLIRDLPQQPNHPRAPRRIIHEIRAHHARMDRRQRKLRVLARHLARPQNDRQLALPVATVSPQALGVGAQGVEQHAFLGGVDVTVRREGDDAHVSVRDRSRLFEDGKQQFREESVPDVVRAELQLVAVTRQARRGGHDAGVQHEDVETGGLGRDGAGGGGDGRERGQVHGEGLDGGRVFDLLADLVRRGLRFVEGARGQPDQRRLVAGVFEDALFAQADVGAGHEDDSAGERGDVLLGVEGEGLAEEHGDRKRAG